MIHCTELLDAGVYDAQGHYVGRVRDLCIVPAEQASRIARLVIVRGRYQTLLARYDQIASVGPGAVRLNAGELELEPYRPDESWLTMRKDLFDQQIIDIHGRKVVRVNDVGLLEQPVNGHVELRVSQVDVGLAGALRRLLKGVVSAAWLRVVEKRLPTRVIPWEFVDMIEPDALRRLKLKLPQSRLAELHPADIADIIEELAPAERDAVIETLDDTTAADALGEVKQDVQARILEEIGKERAADILERMEPDEAADALAVLPADTAAEVLKDMEPQEADELVELLQYEENTAGGLMTPEVFSVGAEATVVQTIEALRRGPAPVDALDTVYVTDTGKVLTGAVPLGRLLLAVAEARLVTLRTEQLMFVDTEAEEKEVIELFDKYNLRSLPVVDSDQKLVGVITADDIIHRQWQRLR
ncbi:MAG: magnesium transporter MgtE N-terminal domain-containing protein [Terriglobia bacterium]